MDTNIDNYTVDELAAILKIDDLSDTNDIITKSNVYIEKYKKENNEKMLTFFQEMQNDLLDYSKSSNINEEQEQDWLTNEALPQKKNQYKKTK